MRAVSPPKDILGESPVWSDREQALYWVDIRAPALRRLGADGAVRSWPMPELAGAVMLRRRGGLVIGLRSGLFAFDPEAARLDLLLALDEGYAENRINDSRCDPAGHIWFSTMWDYGRRQTGSVYRVAADLRIETVAAGLAIPNAICFSPAGDRAYLADTRTGVIECIDIHPHTGALGPRRVFSPAGLAPGRPDGATVDRDGYLWNARYGAGMVARFAPDGRLDRLVEVPAASPTSCAFGGPDRATLYITTATQGLDAAARAAQPLAGSVLAFEPGPSGLPEPAFAG